MFFKSYEDLNFAILIGIQKVRKKSTCQSVSIFLKGPGNTRKPVPFQCMSWLNEGRSTSVTLSVVSHCMDPFFGYIFPNFKTFPCLLPCYRSKNRTPKQNITSSCHVA